MKITKSNRKYLSDLKTGRTPEQIDAAIAKSHADLLRALEACEALRKKG